MAPRADTLLRDIDLNLLVALDVLLAERHVTRAARRMGLSQPAMSQVLKRLRESLDDPILVRSAGKMVPSPYTTELEPQLRAALQTLHQVLDGPAHFDPARSERTFRLALFDHYSTTLLNHLLPSLLLEAPKVQLEIIPLNVTTIRDELRRGELDAALMRYTTPQGDLRNEELFEEEMVSIVRDGHPILDGDLTAERFVQWPHATGRMTRVPGTYIDEQLAEIGLKRTVAARVPYLLASPSMVVSSDLIMTVPRSCAAFFAGCWPIRLFTSPLPTIRFTISCVYMATMYKDSGHRWFRRQISKAAQKMEASTKNKEVLSVCPTLGQR